MGELILHIGTTKTGTTSLQRFLLNNRDGLAEHGICFPLFTEQGASGRRKENGSFVDGYCLATVRKENPGERVNDILENTNRLSEALASNRRVLLTEECIFLAAKKLHSIEGSFQAYWKVMAQFLTSVGANGVTVIVYLRRQDDWIASAWRQKIKGGRRCKSLKDHIATEKNRSLMDYASLLATIERAFEGRARIVVRRYDRAAFEGGDIYHDFCAACGIPWDESYLIPEHEFNPSLSFDVAEALRAFAEVASPTSQLRKDVLIPLAYKLSRENPDPPGMTPFDEEGTRLLMEPYLEGNALISERYLGGEPLFSDEYGRPVWTPDKKRIAAYRRSFERALKLPFRKRAEDRLRPLARKLPDGIKRPLKALLGKQ